MEKINNIALTGSMRSGKSAVAAYLREKYGYTEFAFGDELKADFHRRYPEIPRDPKPRKCYQTHGQLVREYVDEDVWVRKCFAEIKREYYANIPFRAVISDVRQLNEYERCRAEGYVIIRVTAPDSVRIQRAIDAKDTFNYADLAHETESHVSSFVVDYEIENSGSLAELYTKVDEVMTQIDVQIKIAESDE